MPNGEMFNGAKAKKAGELLSTVVLSAATAIGGTMGYLEVVGPDRIVSNASPPARKDAYTGEQARDDRREMRRLFESRLVEELKPIEAKQEVLEGMFRQFAFEGPAQVNRKLDAILERIDAAAEAARERDEQMNLQQQKHFQENRQWWIPRR